MVWSETGTTLACVTLMKVHKEDYINSNTHVVIKAQTMPWLRTVTDMIYNSVYDIPTLKMNDPFWKAWSVARNCILYY